MQILSKMLLLLLKLPIASGKKIKYTLFFAINCLKIAHLPTLKDYANLLNVFV